MTELVVLRLSRPADARPAEASAAEDAALEPPSLELEQLQEAWRRTVLPAVEERSIPTAAMLAEAHPAALAGDTLTLEFPPAAKFHLSQGRGAEERRVPARRALRGDGPQARARVRARRGAGARGAEAERPATEEEIVELMKRTFDAQELELP